MGPVIKQAAESAAGSKMMLKKSMLTMETLDRFEKEVDITLLTEEAKQRIEHCAYCANMGAATEEDAWRSFGRLVMEVSPKYYPNFPRFSLSE
jgi:hypothetical protein